MQNLKGEMIRMNKSELIAEMANTLNSKKEAESALNSLLGTISGALKKGDKVTLPGFGTFKISKRKARTGRNPRTGEAIKIKAHKVPQFAAGKKLKDAVA
jgi:DNA-binding protein HU-beta